MLSTDERGSSTTGRVAFVAFMPGMFVIITMVIVIVKALSRFDDAA
jgi:hypothetical protein